VRFARKYIRELKPQVVISGMALGWDQALAEAALLETVPTHAYIPFEGQDVQWPEMSRRRYEILRSFVTHEVVVCTGGYAAWKMQQRNEAMVNACTHVLALWNGSNGGTANCLRYAREVKKPIINVWDEWNL